MYGNILFDFYVTPSWNAHIITVFDDEIFAGQGNWLNRIAECQWLSQLQQREIEIISECVEVFMLVNLFHFYEWTTTCAVWRSNTNRKWIRWSFTKMRDLYSVISCVSLELHPTNTTYLRNALQSKSIPSQWLIRRSYVNEFEATLAMDFLQLSFQIHQQSVDQWRESLRFDYDMFWVK